MTLTSPYVLTQDAGEHWYGAVRRAAGHTLLFWQHQRLPALLATGDPIAARVDAYVRRREGR